jgi:hypothetical protein
MPNTGIAHDGMSLFDALMAPPATDTSATNNPMISPMATQMIA